MIVQTWNLALVYDSHCLSYDGLFLGNTHNTHQFSRSTIVTFLASWLKKGSSRKENKTMQLRAEVALR